MNKLFPVVNEIKSTQKI